MVEMMSKQTSISNTQPSRARAYGRLFPPKMRNVNVAAISGVAMLGIAVAACANQPARVSADSAEGPGNAIPREYTLGAGDKVNITVFAEENLSGNYVVGPDGNVTLPLAGAVKAEGLTLADFRHELMRTLIFGYVQDPNVSVALVEMRPFFILGEVNKPGKYPYTPDLTVLNAVATAEGFTYRADMSEVYIRHAREATENEYSLTSGTPVRPGDTIRVAERYF